MKYLLPILILIHSHGNIISIQCSSIQDMKSNIMDGRTGVQLQTNYVVADETITEIVQKCNGGT